MFYKPDETNFFKVLIFRVYLAALAILDVHSLSPFQSTMETHRKLDFTSIAKGVVNSVPVSGEECVVEVLVIVQSAGSMWVIAAFIFEQEFKDVCAKVHAYVAPPVYTHLQASVDSGRKG